MNIKHIESEKFEKVEAGDILISKMYKTPHLVYSVDGGFKFLDLNNNYSSEHTFESTESLVLNVFQKGCIVVKHENAILQLKY